MELSQILDRYLSDNRTQKILSQVQLKEKVYLHLKGMEGSSAAFAAAGVYNSAPQSHLIILDDKEQAAYFENDLKTLIGPSNVLFFPDSFKKPGKLKDINKSNVLLRTETIKKLLTSPNGKEILVTYPQALFEKVISSKAFQKNLIHIQNGENLDLDFIIEVMVEYGFDRTDFVYEPGQFSVRGGIVDIYSYGNELPYRVELFGDEVESIRVFDPLTQLSTKKISRVTIIPNIQSQFESSEKTPLFEIIPKNTIVWVKNWKNLLTVNQACYEQALELVEEYKDAPYEEEDPFRGENAKDNFIDSTLLGSTLETFDILQFGKKNFLSKDVVEVLYDVKPQTSFRKNFELLIKQLKINTEEGIENVIFTKNPMQANRFAHIFADLEADVKYETVVDTFYEGFVDWNLKIACYTDHQIFDRFHKYNLKQGYSKDKALTVKLLRELQPRDFVTHIDHGVGIFAGLVKIEVNGKTQEVIKIFYKDKDILYVNINSLHKVSKYIGKEGKTPKVNKLGSDSWASVKRKAKGKIKEIATDLIKLYAERKSAKGISYSPDSFLQTELEASFIYEDTPDQIKATNDFKKDMEADSPMDRLICGDVGFGKTEIAIRAAAKAVADGKQVAVLVPTTILALQHFNTFTDRLKEFPCTVDFLNRFKTAKQKTETLKKLEAGEIDILIGTHAIVGKKVKFKDLGLLVVDEEQKFGVAVKEKLREMRVNVDTLTLTATPIPRTLQFSLLNARDLTVINTPPPNRQPVQTELASFDQMLIKDAINYEVYRGGQVFFIHNRVKDLVEVTSMIKRLCPDVDIGMAHGQLDNKTLEDRMLGFIKGTYDVLVCTNIVESGLDVTNANTIIINNAHWFGLSDLHQLRGRVGRSNRKAFCYLISPPIHSLPDDSRRRLQAIEQFAELGSGFQIAMRDLDIRGAGNLLGGEQSGFISDIGFDMYHKILDEAVQELRETDFKDLFKDDPVREKQYVRDCQMDTDLEILIPDEYVNSTRERLALYTELDNIEEETVLVTFRAKLKDRFGPPPKPVQELFNALRLRWMAKRLGFERIVFKNGKLRLYFISNQSSPFYDSNLFTNIMTYVQQKSQAARFKQTGKHFMVVYENINSMHKARELLRDMEDLVLPKKQEKASK